MGPSGQLSDLFSGQPPDGVPGTHAVDDLDAALGLIPRLGGSVASETRTAPGIGSWAFVADADGSELVLWQSADSARF
jgi:predicted enzyme related to lactoylglutathione lyase